MSRTQRNGQALVDLLQRSPLRDVTIDHEPVYATVRDVEPLDRMIDCVAHGCTAAEGLLAGGKRPWIGRIRDRRGDFSGPLVPRTMPDICWTTHYVCCCDGEVHDPLAGGAIPIGEYSERMFGRVLNVLEIVGSDEVAELVARGTLRATLQRLARP